MLADSPADYAAIYVSDFPFFLRQLMPLCRRCHCYCRHYDIADTLCFRFRLFAVTPFLFHAALPPFAVVIFCASLRFIFTCYYIFRLRRRFRRFLHAIDASAR